MVSINHSKEQLRCRERAVDALIRLHADDLVIEEGEELNPWNLNNPVYLSEFLSAAHLLGEMEALANDPDILAAANRSRSEMPVKKRDGLWFVRLAVASIVVAVSVMFGLYLGRPADSENLNNMLRYTTRVGEQKTVELADGSVLTLNTGTELLVDLNTEYRRVLLKRGEAYFDIAKEPGRGFRVEVGNHLITVLGTEFNLYKTSETFTLAVLEGVVALHQQGDDLSHSVPSLPIPDDGVIKIDSPQQYKLQAGWVVLFDEAGGHLTGSHPENIGAIQSWRRGMMEFSGAPLYQVVKELNRYSAKKILIEDPFISNYEIYAVLHVGNIRETLSGLEKTLPIKIQHEFDRISIVGSSD